MAPRCYPPDPPNNPGEAKVWKALHDGLRDSDVLLHGIRFTAPQGDVEVDMAVLMPDVGFAVIEVKGGTCYLENGQWFQWGPRGTHKIEPVEQAVKEKHAMARFLAHDPRWHYGRVRMGHVIAFPDTPLSDEFRVPGIEDDPIVLDKTELSNAAAEVWDRMRMPMPNQPKDGPGEDAVDLAVQLLAATTDPKDRIAAARAYRESYIDALTQQRGALLKALREVRRYEVHGGPGTGKTWMALELTKMLALQGQRVALLCYSRGLATYLHHETTKWRRRERPALVSTFHGLASMLDVDIEPTGPDYWNTQLPAVFDDQAVLLAQTDKFDAVVVDEAQDFGASWWRPVLSLLRTEPGLYVFGDVGQRVFDRQGTPDVDLVPIILDQNIRNTRQIGLAVNHLGTEPMRLLGGEGPDITWHDVPNDAAVMTADEQIDALLDDGWQPQDIVLLTTKSQHPVQAERLSHGREAYWSTLFDNTDIFYSTVAGFKGLERPVVVLAIDGFHDGVDPRDVMYVGMSRARDLLVVCGPRHVLPGVRAVAGTVPSEA